MRSRGRGRRALSMRILGGDSIGRSHSSPNEDYGGEHYDEYRESPSGVSPPTRALRPLHRRDNGCLPGDRHSHRGKRRNRHRFVALMCTFGPLGPSGRGSSPSARDRLDVSGRAGDGRGCLDLRRRCRFGPWAGVHRSSAGRAEPGSARGHVAIDTAPLQPCATLYAKLRIPRCRLVAVRTSNRVAHHCSIPSYYCADRSLTAAGSYGNHQALSLPRDRGPLGPAAR